MLALPIIQFYGFTCPLASLLLALLLFLLLCFIFSSSFLSFSLVFFSFSLLLFPFSPSFPFPTLLFPFNSLPFPTFLKAYVVAHAFTPDQGGAGQLTVAAGERLTLVHHAGNGWLMATADNDGRRGLVHESYVILPEVFEARQLPEYRGEPSRFQLEQIFDDQSVGTFCVHTKPDTRDQLQLSLKYVTPGPRKRTAFFVCGLCVG